MSQFGAAWANPAGELYWIEKLWPKAHALATAKNREQGNQEVCVWTNQYGKGRVFGTTLGHHNETVSAPQYLDLITRGLLWSCDKLNDDYLKKPQPKLVRVNLAQGAKATASSEQRNENHFAKHAVDGDPATRWCVDNGMKPAWLMIELPKPTKLTGCKIDWEFPNGQYRYTIECQVAEQRWQTVVNAANNDKPANVTHDFQVDQVRAVRVNFLGAHPGAWGSISELQLFGDETKMVAVESGQRAREREQELLKDVRVPPQFEARLFAAPPAVNYPTFVACTPSGDVYVAVDKNGSLDRAPRRGSIIKLRDVDGDGRADQSQLFVADVDSPRGLVWDRDRLYVLHPPHLSAFIDQDGDGQAEEQKILVKDLAFTFKDRPADHTSNGVTLGIDGWLYLAIGDFGFMKATGSDGRELQFRGGGVVRVRPDGTNLEVFSRGTRNILEVSLDPLLNGFCRDNTNDGGGWDIRLHHFSGGEHHGYPSLYMNFNEEAVKPLADYGGGSGCGGLFLSEPGFPAGFAPALYTCDWGREWIYRHQLKPSGATFTADQSEFIRVPRVTDLDVDGQGQLVIASWKGASFTYVGEEVGFLVSVRPKRESGDTWQTSSNLNFAKLSTTDLMQQLRSLSHIARLAAQRELIHRPLNEPAYQQLASIVADPTLPLECRVAALFTFTLSARAQSIDQVMKWTADPILAEYALRAVADYASSLKPDDEAARATIPMAAIARLATSESPRIRNAVVFTLSRIGTTPAATEITRLATDADPVVAHTARRALVELQAADACLNVLRSESPTTSKFAAVLSAARQIHRGEVVTWIAEQLNPPGTTTEARSLLLTALCRLHYREGEWKGDSWGTRPDTTGPYYQRESWSETTRIGEILQAALAKATVTEAALLTREMDRHRIPLDGALQLLVTLAKQDRALRTTLAAQLARSNSKSIPASAVELLVAMTSDALKPNSVTAEDAAHVTGETIVNVMTVLSRDGSQPAAVGLLQAQAALQLNDTRRGFAKRGREILFASPHWANHWELLTKQANEDGEVAEWSKAVLVLIAVKSETPAEPKAALAKWLASQWQDPQREASLLRAIARAGRAEYASQVLAARLSAHADVRAAASAAIQELKLDAGQKNGPKIAMLKVEEAVEKSVASTGDKALGELLFERLNCGKCHTTRKDQPPRGPYLGTIANTYKRKDLAEAILIPSKTLAQGFVTNVFEMEDGTTVTGFVVVEAADKVTIRNADGIERELVVNQIERRTKQNISLMPEGIAKELSIHELASLIDYLEALPKSP
jgi:putative membrane-bound dehydrogenase-like protein